MVVAAIYVWDVAGARRPMEDAYAPVRDEVQDTVRDLRSWLTDAL